jgi:hypothetical protein
VKNELNTLKVGVFGSLKKGENWQPYPPDPPNEPKFTLKNMGIAPSHAPGKQVYANLEYTNYDVGAAERADFKDANRKPIVTIDQVPAQKKQGRFYGRTQTDPAKTHASFQTALHTLRKTQFTEKLAKKKAANKTALTARQTQITTGTQSELDEMTRVYTAKKTELQTKLEETFKEHKNKVLANKEKVADKQYDKAPHLLLTNDLQKAGEGVIGGLLKPRETRRRHRFMHLLVKPGDAVVPAPAAPVDTRTPENIALAKAQATLANSEAALQKLAGPAAGAGAGAAGAGPAAGAGATLLTPLLTPPPRPASGSPGALPLPPSPGPPSTPPSTPPSPGGGSRKRKTKRKHRRSSK